eukprot:4545385-Amphidinium_carterae.1
MTKWAAFYVDRSCLPRRAGGPALMRGRIGAYERCIELALMGIYLVTGAVAEVVALRDMLGAPMPRMHLGHPALDVILPLSAKSLVLNARNATAKRLIAKLNGIYAGFTEGRTGVA